jgi:uncharacterized iron-regulated protein
MQKEFPRLPTSLDFTGEQPMKNRLFVSLFAFAFTTAIFLFAVGACRAHILRVGDGTFVTFSQMIGDLAGVNLVFIGELHDNEADHQAQLEIIRALYEAGVPLAIGLEMFREENQNDLDRWVDGRMGVYKFQKVFERNWGMWPLYEPIFLFARENNIPMVGLNIPREITSQVASKGFSSLSQEQLSQLPTGVTCTVSPAYRKFIRKALKGHFHRQDTFTHFCEAQMLWDSVMAQNLIRYLKAHPGTTVVTLAGAGHAWKFGIPERISEQSDLSYRVVLPEIPGRITAETVAPSEADYLLIGLGEGPLH